MAYGQHGTGVGASTTWGELLRLERGVSQREFSLPAHAAARARLYEELTLHGRARLAACQGGGAGRWLAALPLPGPGGAAFSGDAMRVAVRLWLGVAPRSAPPGHRCRCGAEVDAEGRHFLGPCLALKRRATHLHTTIVKQVEGALGESAVWRDVVVEPELYPGAPESLRPDLRATRVTSGRRTWADVSLASPLEARELARVAAAPLAPLAAAKRERGKAAKYEAALPAATPPSEFAPLVWETFGRVGPATAAFLRSALGGPGGTSARSALLRGVSVAIWRSHAWAVATGYANCFCVDGVPGEAPGDASPDLTGVSISKFLDIDRFGSVAAVTLRAAAAAEFRAALRTAPTSTVLTVVEGADAWSAALLGPRRRAQLGPAAAAAAAADLCRRRLTAKLRQLAGRVGLPPHLRASLAAHVAGELAAHPAAGAATTAAAAAPAGAANTATPPAQPAPADAALAALPPTCAAPPSRRADPPLPPPLRLPPARRRPTLLPRRHPPAARRTARRALRLPLSSRPALTPSSRRRRCLPLALPARPPAPPATGTAADAPLAGAPAALAVGGRPAEPAPPTPAAAARPAVAVAAAGASAAPVDGAPLPSPRGALPPLPCAAPLAAAMAPVGPAAADAGTSPVTAMDGVVPASAAAAPPSSVAARAAPGGAPAVSSPAGLTPPAALPSDPAQGGAPTAHQRPPRGAPTPLPRRSVAPPPAAVRERIPSTPGWGGVGAPAPLPAAPWLAGGPSPPPCATSAQRRALRQARHGRLSAAARTLLSEPPAPRTPAVWAKAQQLFPPSSPDLATAASVEAAFPDELAALAAAAGQLAVPRTVSRDTVTLAIRAAPRGEALVGVVLLLTGEAAVTRVPSVARTALAGADLLLLRKPGGLAADGLPKLRPIGMPEALRKLAASALARTVRDAAAALLGPHQQGVGVRSACERVLHELRAQLAACPTQAAVQLDFSNAFNRVSRTAARGGAPRLLIRAFHDDVVAVGPPADLARFVGAAGVAGSAIDAALAPAKFFCAAGGDDFLSAGVDAIAADHSRLVAAISQLHLLRLCAGPRANFWLRALPLVWGARLAGAVDRDARSALTALLCDAADPPARRAALLERAALPVAMGGLGIGGRVRVAPAAALASWLDALRAGRAYSPALRAVAAALSERPVVAADGGPVAPPPPPTSLPSAARADPAAVPSSAAAGLAAPPLTAEEVAAGASRGPGGRAWWGERGPSRPRADRERSAVPAAVPPPVSVARTVCCGANPPVVTEAPVSRGAGPPRADGRAPAPGPGDAPSQPAWPAPLPAVPPRALAAHTAPPCAAPGLVAELMELRDAQVAIAAAPARDAAGLWAAPPGRGPARVWAHLAPTPPPLPPHPPTTPPAVDAPPPGAPAYMAYGQHGTGVGASTTWGELLRLERGVSQRGFSLPAHAAARARLYEELTLHGRARLAASPATALPPIYFLGSMGGDGARIEPIARAVAAVLDVAVTTTTTMTTMDRAELLIQGVVPRSGGAVTAAPAPSRDVRGARSAPDVVGRAGAQGGDATPMEGVVASGREGAGGSTRAESGRSGVCGVPGGVPGAPQEAPGDASRAGAVPPAALVAGSAAARRRRRRRDASRAVPPDAAAPSAGGAAGVVGASAAARGGAPRGVSRAGAPAPPPLTGDVAGAPVLPRAPAARPAATWAAVAARPAPAPAVARPARSPAASAPRAPASGPLAADRAHAAAAELLGAAGGHERRVALETILVSGISRDVRAHRLRHLIADLTGVSISKFLDIDRFGSVAAVTLRAAAAAEFRAALRTAPTSTVLTVVEGADAWSAALLGPRRRAQLGPAAAAAAAADLCRRRLTAKLRQLAGRLAAHPAAGAATTAAAAAPAGAANTATPPAQPAPADAALAALPPTCAAPPSPATPDAAPAAPPSRGAAHRSASAAPPAVVAARPDSFLSAAALPAAGAARPSPAPPATGTAADAP
ncbi:hypothetical protein MMPV_008767 [Pyropia vietnamensis]